MYLMNNEKLWTISKVNRRPEIHYVNVFKEKNHWMDSCLVYKYPCRRSKLALRQLSNAAAHIFDMAPK